MLSLEILQIFLKLQVLIPVMVLNLGNYRKKRYTHFVSMSYFLSKKHFCQYISIACVMCINISKMSVLLSVGI